MRSLVLNSFRYYWRTHLATIAGVAVAVAVLAGALLVGGSVRASLRDLLLGRLGNVASIATSAHFFREQLALETDGCPIIVMEAAVTNPETHRRAGQVSIYGVDDRFWRFQNWLAATGVLVTAGLEREVGAGELLIRLDKPSAIPKESLHGRKDEGRTIRVRPARTTHEFSLKPQQGDVLAVYMPLSRLQRELAQPGHINTILYSRSNPDIAPNVTLDDLGVRIRQIASGGFSIESDTAIVNDALTQAAGPDARGVFSYLANTIRVNGREIPYSLVTAVDSRLLEVDPAGMYLNEWAASELNAHTGDTATFDYYVWAESGHLLTRTATLRVQGVLPIRGLAADRDLTPEYPGITQARTIRDWDPPFPMDLARIRPADEAYWNRYRTTPKAFIALATGQRLWGSRFGRLTLLRSPTGHLATLHPFDFGLGVYPVRADGLTGARGSTDFGEYFTYFSFFLVASAALLTALFFRLGIEQRASQVATLRALGWPLAKVRRLLLSEGVLIASAGVLAGIPAAIAYCAFVLYGLRTWWRGAVGTSALRLHINTGSLAAGAALAGLIAIAVIWLSLRRSGPRRRRSARWAVYAAIAALLGAAVLAAGRASEAFFGAGTLLLIASVLAVYARLSSARGGLRRSATMWRLGIRNAAFRPGRSALAIALIASAVFLLVSLDAFRHSGAPDRGPKSGTGGFPLLAESQLPIFWDPNSPAGRENLNLAQVDGVKFFSFRLRPGEDASCLNLYEPRNPRVLGAPEAFLKAGRFSFEREKDNPWLLLDGDASIATPAIADANSITYVLHRKVGDEIVVGGKKLKLVAALAGSVLQGELIISERNFVRLFPQEQGYRFFLLDAPSPAAGAALEEALSDYGFDAVDTAGRLAAYHGVENTYLSTFQALGALGLLLGTAGLAAVLLRNVLERRRELALLTALGYRREQLGWVALAENAFLVGCGLAAGALSAALAVTPAVIQRGGQAPVLALLLLLVAVPLTALVSSLLAIRVVLRMPMLEALRSE